MRTIILFTFLAALSACGIDDSGKKGKGTSLDALGAGTGFGSGTNTVSVGSGSGGGSAPVDQGSAAGSGSAADSGPVSEPGLSDSEAFVKTVYPIVRENCKGCHERSQTPFFAAVSPEQALKAIQDTGKVDFEHVEESRLYQRLFTLNHNCWTTCTADAATMLTAIQTWKDLLKKAAETPAQKIETAPLSLAQAVDREKQTDPSTLAAEAESATLTAPMQIGTNTNASGGKFLSVPTGNGGAIANANTANIGSAVYTFDVKVAGTYNVWGLVNAPAAASNRFFVRIDAGAFTTWTITANADKFVWTKVAGANNAILQATLTAGTHTVEVRRAREAAALDVIALTSNAQFDGTQAVFGKAHVLRYDLSAILGKPDTWFEIEMDDFTTSAYKFRNPRIVTPADKVHVKGVRVLVNGVHDPQDATYNLVDKVVAAPGDVLSTAAMVVIKDKGPAEDMITFTFDGLEIAP